jgi:O-antigen/teichoic acid export membrane protein
MLCFSIHSFYVIPHSLLLREMNFKIISVIDESCGLCGAVTSLLFALSGYGVWSLVYGTMVQFFSRAVCFTVVATVNFMPLFRIERIKECFRSAVFYWKYDTEIFFF